MEAVLRLLAAARLQQPAVRELPRDEEAAEAAGVALHALLVLLSGGARACVVLRVLWWGAAANLFMVRGCSSRPVLKYCQQTCPSFSNRATPVPPCAAAPVPPCTLRLPPPPLTPPPFTPPCLHCRPPAQPRPAAAGGGRR